MRRSALVLGMVVTAACSDETAAPANRTFKSPAVVVGGGMARSELVFNGADELESISVVFTEGALTNLPATLPNTEFIIPLPTGTPTTVFNHLGINWQPNGHPPPVVYTHPHFDVHFYLIPISARDAMTPADPAFAAKATKVPLAEETPARYLADPQGIPRMGTHWTHQDSHEFHGQLFTNTMVYGFYDGKMIFIEPMMTKAFLESRPNETKTMSLPARYPAPGRYPTAHKVSYDDAAKEYRVELIMFVTRS
jgi:hypothetical protein